MQEYLALAQQSLYADENMAANLQFAPDKFKMIFSPVSNANNSLKITPTVSYRLASRPHEDTTDTLVVQQMYEEFKKGAADSQLVSNPLSADQEPNRGAAIAYQAH